MMGDCRKCAQRIIKCGDIGAGLARTVRESGMILVGSVLYAASVVWIAPVEIIPGSVLGIAVICNTLLHSPIGLINLMLNIPIMAVGAKFLGKRVLVYTICTLMGTSLLIDLWDRFAYVVPAWPPAVIAISGGALMGLGAGVLLRAGATMGGTTALGRLIQLKQPNLRLGNALLLMDGSIILCGALLIWDGMAFLYSVLYTFFCMKVIDLILYGPHPWKMESRRLLNR